MKNSFVLQLVFILALFILPLNAQVQLGLHAGGQFSDVKMDPLEEGVETGFRTGFLFGGTLFYSFSPIFGIQAEPSYVQKGAKVDITDTEFGSTLKIEGTINANYFDIPILLKASFGEGQVKPYLLAGLTAAFLFGDTKLEFDKLTVDGVDMTSSIPSDEKEQTLETKTSDFLLNFGGGIVIPAGKVNIFIEGQYNLGLTDVNDDPETEMSIKSTGFQIKAGALFPL